MKKIAMVLACWFCSFSGHAQTWDEWFKQGSTQIKYLLAQIAANQVYIDALQKGCAIAQDGLKTINDIKHGDFNLHHDYFSSLNNTNLQIKKSQKAGAIINIQLLIKKDLSDALNELHSCNQFTAAEIQYVQTTSENILNECSKNIDELTILISKGQLSMTDDEKIKRIKYMYAAMQEQLAFERSFTGEALLLCYQRKAETSDVLTSKKLAGSK